MPILWMLLVLLPTTVYCICNAKKRAAQYPADAHRTLSKADELTARAVEEVFPLLPDVWKVDGVEKNDANRDLASCGARPRRAHARSTLSLRLHLL